MAGFREALLVTKGVVENFWDSLWPEIEDGDYELRAAPLEWIGTRLIDPLKKAPLTKNGLSFYKYRECRTVPSEEEAAANEQKAEQRQIAIAEGKLTQEEWESAFKATPREFYESRVADLDSLLETAQALDDVCTEKFTDSAPTFTPLKEGIEEVRHLARQLLNRKYELEGGGPARAAAAEEEAADDGWTTTEEAPAAPAAAKRRRAPSGGAEPVDADDAAARIGAAAKFLRGLDAYSPAPYLLLRGLRWGELRAGGESPDQTLFAAPDSEVRQNIKRLALEGNWTELLEVAEAAMAEPCGRAWLDLQRYVVRACDELGYYAIANAIRSEVRNLIRDYPQLPSWTLMDDTPTANAETQAWLLEINPPAPEPAAAEAAPEPDYSWSAPEPAAPPAGEEAPPTAYQLALQAAQAGRNREAIELITEDLGRQSSGRGKFQRKVELAQICLATGYQNMAEPILEELAQEIEAQHLERWEDGPTIAHPLVLLYRCTRDEARRQELYAKICRLDPVQALACGR
jgi:type VI secretion system protein ImpA